MRRLRAWFVLAVAVVLTGLWLVPAEAVTQTPNVVARNSHGVVLPPDPLLTRGEQVQLTITGFAPGAHLTVRLGTTSLGSYVADSSGKIVFTFTVPVSYGKGEYIVAAFGLPPLHSVATMPASHDNTLDPQGVETVVPNLGIFTFRLEPGHSSTSPTRPPTSSTHPSTSPGSGGAGGSSGNAGGLGHTGVDVSLLLLIGAVGLVGGLLIMLPGRNRKHA